MKKNRWMIGLLLIISFFCLSLSPVAAASQKKPLLTVYTAYDAKKYVSGTTIPTARVTVYSVNGKKINTATAYKNGYFRVTVNQKAGVKLKVMVIDGTTKESMTKIITVRPAIKPALYVNRIFKSASVVTGKTAPKTYVSVFRSTGKKVAGTMTDSKGNFKIPVSGLSGKYVFMFATDIASKGMTKKVINLDLSANPASTILLGAPFIDQNAAGAPMGCEGASLLEALHYQGKALNVSLRQLLEKMPIAKDDNPNHGFGGSPFYLLGRDVFQSIYPAPLAKFGQAYGNTQNISGSSVSALKGYLRKGSPVVVYIVMNWEKPIYHQYKWGVGIDNSHVVLLDGFKKGAYHIADPNSGKYWVSASAFETSYNYKKFAVVVQP